MSVKVTKQLKDKQMLKEKETLILVCQFNKPNVSVNWKKNGDDIEKSERIIISVENREHTLTINDVSKDDEGDYQCICTDDVMSKCAVTIKEIPLKFTKGLKDTTVTEKETFVLRCESNKRVVSVKWLKGDEFIKDDTRVKLSSNQCIHELVLEEACEADTGIYTCFCNDNRTQCTVTVKEIAAKFTEHLKDETVLEKETLVLRCELNKPNLAVTWLKNGQRIQNSSRIQIRVKQCWHELVFKDVSKKDTGVYECVCSNDKTKCNVTVKELPVEFTKRLEDEIVKEEDTLKLRCVLNKPDESVNWFKDDKPITETGKIKFVNDLCEHKLVIEDVSKEDAGKYEAACKAGYTECNVEVKELPVQFTKGLTNRTVEEKQTLRLTCELNRVDVQVQWLKSGTVIKDERISEEVDQNIHQLVIRDTRKEDSGEYKCVCRDIMKTSCNIKIEDIPSNSSEKFIWVFLSVLSSVLLSYAINSFNVFETSASNNSGVHVKEIDGLQTRIDGINETILSIKQQEDEVKDSYSNMLSKFREEINDDKKQLQNMSSTILAVKSYISTKANEKDLIEMSSHLRNSLNKTEEQFAGEIEKIEKSFAKKLDEFNQSKTEFEKKFNQKAGSLQTFEKETKEKLKLVDDTLSDMNNKTSDLKQMFALVETQLISITKAKEEADTILARIKKDVDRIMPNTFNKEALTIAFLVLIVFVFLLAFWIYRVQCMLTPGGLDRNQSMNAADVLQQIPMRVSLSNSICIISFDEARQAAHEALVTSAFMNVGNVKMEYFVVRRHEHLLRLPKCKFFIMCTEFSERHVIIEEPGLGLGDLKRCTYEAIQRYGAQMIILYTRDPGSRTLGDQLYNHRIHCVSAQPELVGLRDRDRFLSTYDELTDLQKRSLNDTIKQCLQ